MKGAAVAFFLAIGLLASGRAAMAYSPANLSAFAFQPHPGMKLPLAAPLVDEQGRPVTLGDFFTGKPIVLVLDYLRCKSLCGLTLENVIAALDALPLDAGRDFQMLAISIDPRDTPAENARAAAKYLAGYHHKGGRRGIHFLTGAAGPVRQIADAIGFPYQYDAETDQYIHPAGFIIGSPDGVISRYIFGVTTASSGLRAGLADAAQGRSIGPLTRLFLFCHTEGVPLGRYTVPVLAAFTICNVVATAVFDRCLCRDPAPSPRLIDDGSLGAVLAAHRCDQRRRRQ
jgi:protein SCO1